MPAQANPKEAAKNKNGRPPRYTKKLGERVCQCIATHPESLATLCGRYKWMPTKRMILRWLQPRGNPQEKGGFCHQYARAKKAQAHLFAEECVDIADEEANLTPENLNHAKLRIDTRKWFACKLLPKEYGDYKRAEELEDKNDALRDELRELRDDLASKNRKEF